MRSRKGGCVWLTDKAPPSERFLCCPQIADTTQLDCLEKTVSFRILHLRSSALTCRSFFPLFFFETVQSPKITPTFYWLRSKNKPHCLGVFLIVCSLVCVCVCVLASIQLLVIVYVHHSPAVLNSLYLVLFCLLVCRIAIFSDVDDGD